MFLFPGLFLFIHKLLHKRVEFLSCVVLELVSVLLPRFVLVGGWLVVATFVGVQNLAVLRVVGIGLVEGAPLSGGTLFIIASCLCTFIVAFFGLFLSVLTVVCRGSWLQLFNPFHELKEGQDTLLFRVKVLSVHLLRPAVWCRIQDDFNDFIFA
jgi:hypothetical protein